MIIIPKLSEHLLLKEGKISFSTKDSDKKLRSLLKDELGEEVTDGFLKNHNHNQLINLIEFYNRYKIIDFDDLKTNYSDEFVEWTKEEIKNVLGGNFEDRGWRDDNPDIWRKYSDLAFNKKWLESMKLKSNEMITDIGGFVADFSGNTYYVIDDKKQLEKAKKYFRDNILQQYKKELGI